MVNNNNNNNNDKNKNRKSTSKSNKNVDRQPDRQTARQRGQESAGTRRKGERQLDALLGCLGDLHEVGSEKAVENMDAVCRHRNLG